MNVEMMRLFVELVISGGICGSLCTLMVIINKKLTDKFLDTVKENNKQYTEELSKWVEIVNNNTLALNKLADRISYLENLQLVGRKDGNG